MHVNKAPNIIIWTHTTQQYGTVLAITTDFDSDLGIAPCGENVRVVISGVAEENVHSGFVICDADHPIITPVPQFEAQLAIIDLLDHKPIFSPGYTAVLHAHTAVEECSIKVSQKSHFAMIGLVYENSTRLFIFFFFYSDAAWHH